MLARIKFCGMKRSRDAALAAELGVAYIGVVFADGPRCVSAREAREILDAAGDRVKRVGVFGTNAPEAISRDADTAGLDVVQLQLDPTGADVIAIRESFKGDIWAAVRIGDAHIPDDVERLFEMADAIVFDARHQHLLGGTGEALPWSELAADLARIRGSYSVVLAGGLNHRNVGTAIRTLAPDVVDVSSGIESSPGVKDPALMRSFVSAVAGTRSH